MAECVVNARSPNVGLRLLLAAAAAAVAIVALNQVVGARERTGALATAPLRAPQASPLAGLGFVPVATDGVVLLVSRVDAVPATVAPVLQVLADGTLAVRRAPPLGKGPLAVAGDVAIVVPRSPLAAWSPAARGALAELLAALVVARPVPRERVRLVDVPFGESELRALLAWLP